MFGRLGSPTIIGAVPEAGTNRAPTVILSPSLDGRGRIRPAPLLPLVLGRGGVTIRAPMVMLSIDGLGLATRGVLGVFGVLGGEGDRLGLVLLPLGRRPVYVPAPATAMSFTMPSISL